MIDEKKTSQQTEETPSAKQVKFALEEKWDEESSSGKGNENMAEQPTSEDTLQDQHGQSKQPAFDTVVNDNFDKSDEFAANDDFEKSDFEKIAQERDEYLDHMKRLQAEFDNFRKRTQREKVELSTYMLQNFITQLLPVADTFQRAMESASGASDIESYRQGVEMVYRQFMNILNENGLEKIATVGEPFDPNLHEAVNQVETGEHEPGTIVSEFSPGYKLKDRVIQAPKVQVAIAVST